MGAFTAIFGKQGGSLNSDCIPEKKIRIGCNLQLFASVTYLMVTDEFKEKKQQHYEKDAVPVVLNAGFVTHCGTGSGGGEKER